MTGTRSQGRWRRKEQIRRAVLFAAALLLLGLAPVIARAQTGPDTLTLAWTAPGDDGSVGQATTYDVRLSTSPITDANFAAASSVPGLPSPAISGTRQKVVVRGLTRGTTYYFALKSTDDAGNVSAISNIVRWDWVYDTSPPATPTGLTANVTATGAVHLHWNANSEPDLGGYKIYRATAGAGGPWTRIDGPALTATNDYTDSSPPTGFSQLWYAVTASDISGNESGRTGAVSVTFGGSSVFASTSWHLDPVYPNPSRIGSPVTLPVNVGNDGAGSIEITDAGRHLIRHIDLSALAPGPQLVTWDGLNDAGRPVTPGYYTAWVVGGGNRQSVKLVRVP
jgi:hypothetical protein